MARLFEQSGETTPGNLADRLAYGRSGVPTKNITLQNFVNWVSSIISALRPSNNLSDVDDLATARTNLDVYDTTTIDDALFLKADKTNVLEKDNTTSYTPTQDYHPMTLKSGKDLIYSIVGVLVYSARIDKNETSVSVTEHYNNDGSGSNFISSVSGTTGTLDLFLTTPDSNWETNLEIQGTANAGTGSDAINRNPHFFLNDNTRISMYFVDSSGNAASSGAVWVRIYDWS